MLEGCFPDVQIYPQRYWKEVVNWVDYPLVSQWIEEEHEWEGSASGALFPTAMKSIPRSHPPPRPAGLEKCSRECVERWTRDQFRFPPYQYSKEFLITTPSTWRLLNAEEKELLLGYGFQHTKYCWPASKIKQQKTAYKDARLSYLGDSFSIHCFVLFAVACSRKWLPSVPFKHLASRMGMAPGFRAHLRSSAPLARRLCYGTELSTSSLPLANSDSLNRILLRRTNHTGADIRVVSGELMSNKTFPRESVSAQWWEWSEGFANRWKQRSHINVLELETVLLGIKHHITHFQATDMRIFQLSDSYICIGVVAKGRSSSRQLQRVLKKIAGHLLAHGLHLVMAHVDSASNPTDLASRR